MKQIAIFAFILVLTTSLVLAVGPAQGIHEPGTGIENPEVKQAGQGSGQGMQQDAVLEEEQNQMINTEMQTMTQEQNRGEDTQLQNQIQTRGRIHAGEYTSETGKQFIVQEQTNNRLQFKSGNSLAETTMDIVQEQVQERTRLKVKLANGKDTEVKIMPDTASEKALERLRLKVCSAENNCQIELKEVGQGEQVRAAYEMQVQKKAKILGLFKSKMQVRAQIDAETGEVIMSKKPWWAFLASESEE